MRLLHTMLRVGDLDKSLAFYTEVLNMKLLRRKDYPDGRFTLAFVGYGKERDTTVLELTHNWDTPAYDLGAGYGHIAIEVDNAAAACAAVRAKGGKVIREAAPPPLDAVDWAALCARFSGVQRQVPPVYSALKVGGERAYALARRGELPQLEAREVVIHELRFLGMDGDGARFFVRCSKGTYIRSLLRDMAAALGSAGHTHALRRVAVAGLTAMTPLATLRAWQEAGDMAALQALLLPLDCCVAHLPRVVVPPEKLRFIRNGNDIACDAPYGEVALYDGARFFGVGEARDGRVFPQRLCALPPV